MAANTGDGIVYCPPRGQAFGGAAAVAAAVAAGGVAVRELSLVGSGVGVELARLTVPVAVVAGFGHMGMAVKEDSRVWPME